MKIRPLVVGAALAATTLTSALAPTAAQGARSQDDATTLRASAPKDLKIGTALASIHLDDKQYARFAAAQFNSVTPENEMKWESIHPSPGVYNFGPGDEIVRFAKKNKQVVRGHTLLWHSQNPAWVNDANWTCKQARGVLKDHINTVVSHYRGKIQQWDVANEVFHDAGDPQGVALRTDQNPFLKACSDDPVALIGDAFRWAHRADPKAKLFINDYNVEGINPKTDAYYALVKELLVDGVPIDGFGLQAHLGLQYGFDGTLQANMERFDALGLETAITEADVRMETKGATAQSTQQLLDQAGRYGALLDACLKVKGCKSFTVWGFTDKYNWVPQTFKGQDWATITDVNMQPKLSYYMMLGQLMQSSAKKTPRR